jgi:hypothetical protein
MKKLKTILNESVLGELPSAKLFKYNKSTGKFDAPGKRTNEATLNEEYVESMDYIKLANALGVIKTQWDIWKKGPSTEPNDIRPAQKELIDWVNRFLKQNIK